ncbi:uncharacterized protein LOC111616045 [Centruroides sculpturatus]|uniref:uncharacterized protein LOC111616045 n=2 Tax=Centruroides sculpturatus TaxID=218467 RepID=UPI000C6D697D|nr:uncharacterized protein LOC111616045 [Centruroides sculpturatus]
MLYVTVCAEIVRHTLSRIFNYVVASKSPDIKPIKHLWNNVEANIWFEKAHTTCVADLRKVLQQAWLAIFLTILQQVLSTLHNIYFVDCGRIAPTSKLKHSFKTIDDSISKVPGIEFYARYVDDILIIFDSCMVTPHEIEDYANTLQPNIKFTSELEQNQEINYLDVTIKREKTQLVFQTKRNVFTMELRKILNRTTLYEDINKEIKQLFRKYLLNDYPKNKILAKQENKMSNVINIINTKGRKTVRNQLDVAGVVYKVSCDCLQAKSYVGETGRKLEIRLKEHEAAIRLKRQESPWYQHCVNYNCKINRDSVRILYKMENLFKRRVVEHLCIIEHANLLNQNVGLNVDACWEKFICIKGNKCLVVG